MALIGLIRGIGFKQHRIERQVTNHLAQTLGTRIADRTAKAQFVAEIDQATGLLCGAIEAMHHTAIMTRGTNHADDIFDCSPSMDHDRQIKFAGQRELCTEQLLLFGPVGVDNLIIESAFTDGNGTFSSKPQRQFLNVGVHMFVAEAGMQPVAGVQIAFGRANCLHPRPQALADGWYHLGHYLGRAGGAQHRRSVSFQTFIVGMNVAIDQYGRRRIKHCLQLA